MPGTPATTPRFGAPRYANTDPTVDFSGQVNAVSDVFDASISSCYLAAIPLSNGKDVQVELKNAGAAFVDLAFSFIIVGSYT